MLAVRVSARAGLMTMLAARASALAGAPPPPPAAPGRAFLARSADPADPAAAARGGRDIPRLGLGLAALGRPGYINLGHGDDVGPDKSVAALRGRAHAVLDAAWARGIRYFDAARSYGEARVSSYYSSSYYDFHPHSLTKIPPIPSL